MRDLQIAERIGITREAFYGLSLLEQEDWISKWELERETCPLCQNPRSECENPAHEWYPQREVDYAEMAKSAAQWMYDEKHKDRPYHNGAFQGWSKERTAAAPFHYMDGVVIWVSRENLTPEDDFI